METEEINLDTSANNRFRKSPTQRQKWGEDQTVENTNWGDMFFDLFYVAAAFNLADIIKADPSPISLLYFLGCFGPIASIWMNKMLYDGRFQAPDDILHPLFDIIHLCFVGAAIHNIRPVSYMSQGTNYETMMLFCVFVWLANLYNLLVYLEIRHWGVTGQQAHSKHSAVTSIYSALIDFFFVTVATVYSSIVYINANSNSEYGGVDYDEDVQHAPIILLFAAWIARLVAFYPVMYVRGRGKEHKGIMVPVNVNHVIDRCGEWTMIMLGESVLDLLIVPVVRGEALFYLTFFVGILSVIFLQFLYFKSQPHHADEHALRRTRLASAIFTAMLQFYSAGLLLVGVSFKMMLTEFNVEEVNYHKRSLLVTNGRLLEGEESSKYSVEEMRVRVSNFFTLSLLAVFLFLDALILSHKGIKAGFNRFSGSSLAGGALTVFRVAVCVFIGTANKYITSPAILALAGLAAILLQVVVRLIGDVFFPASLEDDEEPKKDDEEINNEHSPNITQPAVEHDDKP